MVNGTSIRNRCQRQHEAPLCEAAENAERRLLLAARVQRRDLALPTVIRDGSQGERLGCRYPAGPQFGESLTGGSLCGGRQDDASAQVAAEDIALRNQGFGPWIGEKYRAVASQHQHCRAVIRKARRHFGEGASGQCPADIKRLLEMRGQQANKAKKVRLELF